MEGKCQSEPNSSEENEKLRIRRAAMESLRSSLEQGNYRHWETRVDLQIRCNRKFSSLHRESNLWDCEQRRMRCSSTPLTASWSLVRTYPFVWEIIQTNSKSSIFQKKNRKSCTKFFLSFCWIWICYYNLSVTRVYVFPHSQTVLAGGENPVYMRCIDVFVGLVKFWFQLNDSTRFGLNCKIFPVLFLFLFLF